jgi:Flp pilus assembly protein TadG
MKKLVAKFIKNVRAIAAVEFALIAPVMITLFFGTIEICNALICQEKVTSIASTAADLVAQDSSISSTQMSDVFNALDAIIYPYKAASASVIVTSIILNSKGKPVVDWSQAHNDTAHKPGDSMTVPDGLITTGGSVIFAEIKYAYSSPTTKFFTKDFVMQDSFYARPRKSATVTGPS